MARPAAEIEPQVWMLSSNSILPGPIRPFASRSIRKLNDGIDLLDEACMSRPMVSGSRNYTSFNVERQLSNDAIQRTRFREERAILIRDHLAVLEAIRA
ncbi:hypothetical protein [Nitrobacter sp. JJSN]|uniref:hypothetical protein n=1 Tax=Nitrobacter sp. JJSN TaxID=3453033 RepID=UPI003F776E0A